MKTAAEAYNDMMLNLTKSSVNVPIHLQGATQARAWWEAEDSLMSKASIAGTTESLAKSVEAEDDEEAHEDERELSNAHNDVHGGDSAEEESEEQVEKSVSASLNRFADALLKKSQGV